MITHQSALWFFEKFSENFPENVEMKIIILVMYALLGYLDDDNAKNIFSILAKFGGKLESSVKPIFEELFEVPSIDNRKNFVEKFTNALSENFPGEENFSFALDSVMILLRRGPERWRYPLLVFLTAIIRYPIFFLHFTN